MAKADYRESFQERLRKRITLGKDYETFEEPEGETTDRRSQELEESRRALKRLSEDKFEQCDGRHKTLEEFMLRITEITTENYDFKKTSCLKCRESYNAVFDTITEGYCVGCATEIFYGDISRATSEVSSMNIRQARREIRAWAALSPAQKIKLGEMLRGH